MTNRGLTKDVLGTLKRLASTDKGFHIDFKCSDLTEEEIATYMKQLKVEQAKERRQEEKRMKKARSFRFSGGLC